MKYNMEYLVKHKLGEGSFAKVFLLCSNTEDSKYALKVIDKDRFSSDERDKCVQEAKLMRKLRQENLCACFDAFEFDNHLLLVTEYCPVGDMYGYLGNCRDATPQEPVPEERITKWVHQIAKALQYLHERKILHRDLKTKNIFLTDDLTVKIGDLGIAKELDFTLAQADTFLGTPLYMSPEIFQFQPYSYKADIWSFGCCLYEMMTLRFAFESPSQQQMVQKILKGKTPNAPSRYSDKMADLARSMLHTDPEDRPHAADIVQIVQNNSERPRSSDSRSSPRSRRRSAASRGSSVDLPDLVSSLRSDRHVIVDSLMSYFQDCTASGLGNGFDISVLNSTRSGLSRTVKTIMTRCPSQEETTLFTRQFGSGLQQQSDTVDSPETQTSEYEETQNSVDNVGYGETPSPVDTVKKSPRKKNRQQEMVSKEDNIVSDSGYEDYHTDPEEVIRWARKNLVTCQQPSLTEEEPDSNQKQQSESQGKARKKKNFLKDAAEKRKAREATERRPPIPKPRSSSLTMSSKNSLKSLKRGDDEIDKSVTLFTRSQKVVFQKSDLLAEENETHELQQSSSESSLKRSCESDLGVDMLRRARQLVKLVKDKKLLQAQLQDLIGWRNYQKYGQYLCEE